MTDEKHSDSYFGTNYVIEVENSSGDDRFIAMALSNTGENYNTWWDWLRSNSCSFTTSNNIGSGKTNSETIKALWDSDQSRQNVECVYVRHTKVRMTLEMKKETVNIKNIMATLPNTESPPLPFLQKNSIISP